MTRHRTPFYARIKKPYGRHRVLVSRRYEYRSTGLHFNGVEIFESVRLR